MAAGIAAIAFSADIRSHEARAARPCEDDLKLSPSLSLSLSLPLSPFPSLSLSLSHSLVCFGNALAGGKGPTGTHSPSSNFDAAPG